MYEDTNLNQVTLTLKMINSIEKSSESAEKSSDKKEQLSNRQKQILNVMDVEKEYSAEEIAALIGLKGSRTRQPILVPVA